MSEWRNLAEQWTTPLHYLYHLSADTARALLRDGAHLGLGVGVGVGLGVGV